MTSIALFDRAEKFSSRNAVISDGQTFTYGQVLDRSAKAATKLLAGKADLDGARVAFLVPPGIRYVQVQWGVWRAGGVVVPLSTHHPVPELAYLIDDSKATIVVAGAEYADLLRPLAAERKLPFYLDTELLDVAAGKLPAVDVSRPAMLIYTSGTTSKPKGVLTTHAIIDAQVRSLVKAWEWTQDDHILHVLPLHHIHGIVNVLGCALYSGALCEFLEKFDPTQVWDRFIKGDGLTLFMAVPTVYSRLTGAWEQGDDQRKAAMKAACQKLRLMVSGSAALPVSTLEKWREVSGHTLLERYGMTEIGMALSNPYKGERRPGSVGIALPYVEARLIDDGGKVITEENIPGEIQVKGETVFQEYYGKPEATKASFTDDGWFKTGDVAQLERGYYRILGRASSDILKTGGYKVSALEIEEVLREHPKLADCAVVGLEDVEWGQKVCLCAVVKPGQAVELAEIRAWAKERLAVYKVPSVLKIMDGFPRNAMGKVNKGQLVKSVS
jgi:malonyl-CoA/methylmalonyl-CoA synthetase